ncbi:hypothetical protein [Hymenobacter algoricola]|uniref:Uncharacterized protein n=1 Tax=Hymenobacter algoricola TaxID=486267 RepID=A0ABP7MB46_9BACT
MPLDYTTLTTRAECDAATVEVDFELLSYTVRDANIDLSEERADRSQASIAAQLSVLDTRIATAEAILGLTTIDAETREQKTLERDTALAQRKKLLKRAKQTTSVTHFLADVGVEQIARQVEVLTAVKAGIAQHRTTLPA